MTRLFLRECIRPVGAGLAAGLLLAVLAGRVMAGTFFGVSTTDPIAFGAAVVFLGSVAAAAVVVPTRRAARTNAASVLRQG